MADDKNNNKARREKLVLALAAITSLMGSLAANSIWALLPSKNLQYFGGVIFLLVFFFALSLLIKDFMKE